MVTEMQALLPQILEIKAAYVMNNQALIENMLDMWLSQKQLEKIKEGWNAFYNDPLKYKGTVVIDMIKLDLQEV